VQAVHDFLRWTTDSSASQMKREFFSQDEQEPVIPAWISDKTFEALARQHCRLGDHAELAQELPAFDSQGKNSSPAQKLKVSVSRMVQSTLEQVMTAWTCWQMLTRKKWARWRGTTESTSETSCDQSDLDPTIKSGGISSCEMSLFRPPNSTSRSTTQNSWSLSGDGFAQPSYDTVTQKKVGTDFNPFAAP